ncbi:MAG: outer membrane lipoprotein carrier protein LolA [Bernardetiaceae bacterium]
MKRTLRLFLLPILLGFLFVAQSQAQYDTGAKKILDTARKKYEAMKGFETDFTYVMRNAAAGVEETLKGHIQVMGDLFVLQTNNQIIYNNREKIWTYLSDVHEVTITDFAEDNTEVSPSSLLRKYEKGFKYLLSDPINGAQVVDLTPEDKNETYFRIRIFFDPQTHLIQKWIMSEKDGTQHTYELQQFAERKDFQKKMFIFPMEKYPKVEVIDLTEG